MIVEDRPLVLFVGWDRGGITDRVARSISAFSRIAISHRTFINEYRAPFESMWLNDNVPADLKPNLIYTTCESAVPDAIEIGIKLGCLYHGLTDANVPCDKHFTYRMLSSAEIKVPSYHLVASFEQFLTCLNEFKRAGIQEAIIKPRNAAGSAGVTKVSYQCFHEEDQARKTWHRHATAVKNIDRISYPRLLTNEFILQEYVSKDYSIARFGSAEYALEIFCNGDDVDIVQVHEKWFMPSSDPFVEPVYIAPPQLTDARHVAELNRVAINAVKALKLRRGLAHVELRASSSGFQIIDVAARAGGKLVGRAVYESRGFDPHVEAIRQLVFSGDLAHRGSLGLSDMGRITPTALLSLVPKKPVFGAVKAIGIESIRQLPSYQAELLLQKSPEFFIKDLARDYYADVVLSNDCVEKLNQDIDSARRAFKLNKRDSFFHQADQSIALWFLTLLTSVLAWLVSSPTGPELVDSPIAMTCLLLLFCATVAALSVRPPELKLILQAMPLLAGVAAAGWTIGRLEESRQQQFVESFPRLSLETQHIYGNSNSEAKLSLVVRAKNDGKSRIDLSYSRVCIFGISEANPTSKSVKDNWKCWRHSGGGIRESAVGEAIQGAGRFWCEAEKSSRLCFRPFSEATHLMSGESVQFDYAIPGEWLQKAPQQLFVRSEVDFFPDDHGLACGVVAEGITQYFGVRGNVTRDDVNSAGSLKACESTSDWSKEISDLEAGVSRLAKDDNSPGIVACVRPEKNLVHPDCFGASSNSVIVNPVTP